MPRDLAHQPCSYPGCARPAKHMLPACIEHWRDVPGPVRRRLATAASAFDKDPYDDRARDEYNAAHRAAADALASMAPDE